jgi:hypothetical protein
MAFAFKPSGANSINVAYGVDNELQGYIVQNEDITENMENLTIPDQKGRTCQVIAYDKGMTLSLTVIGPSTAPCDAGDTFTWKDKSGTSQDYIVQSVRRSCVYNDTAKWVIEATAWVHATYSDKSEDAL